MREPDHVCHVESHGVTHNEYEHPYYASSVYGHLSTNREE